MIDSIADALPCPFCLGDSLVGVWNEYAGEGSIRCSSCGALGPLSPDFTTAINRWNNAERGEANGA